MNKKEESDSLSEWVKLFRKIKSYNLNFLFTMLGVLFDFFFFFFFLSN
jgi:hypothetical protein